MKMAIIIFFSILDNNTQKSLVQRLLKEKHLSTSYIQNVGPKPVKEPILIPQDSLDLALIQELIMTN